MRRIEGHRFAEAETMLFKHRRGAHALVAGGRINRPSAGKFDPMRAREVKPVKADHEEEVEHHLAAPTATTPPLGRILAATSSQVARRGSHHQPSGRCSRPGASRETTRRTFTVHVGLELVATAAQNTTRFATSCGPLVELPVFSLRSEVGVSRPRPRSYRRPRRWRSR